MFQIIEIILLILIISLLVIQKPGGIYGLIGRRRKIILDSCALIDGRVIEIVRSGFIADQLLIPQFILNELQLLADGGDAHKRERARFGLDIVRELQEIAPERVSIDRDVINTKQTTDDKLILLSKKRRAQLYTTDYNLAKVAGIEGVHVLNVNELAQNMRPATLPGESLNIKIIQRGTNRDQGVGYLDDGTMIVVDDASRYIGRNVAVTVTRMHQTVAGKMVFGQVKERSLSENAEQDEHSKNHGSKYKKTISDNEDNTHNHVAEIPHPLKNRLSSRLVSKAKLIRPARSRVSN